MFTHQLNPFLGVFFSYFIVGILIYSNTFNSPFFYDDHHVIGNLTIEQSIEKCKIPQRCLAHLSFALNLIVGGHDVRSFHIVNTLIHIATAYSIFLILFQLLTCCIHRNSRFQKKDLVVVSSLCGAIFLTHPLATQSVTYICQRYTSLATFFYLMGLTYFIRARRRIQKHDNFLDKKHLWLYLTALLFGIMAMFTKEFPVTFPAIIILTELFFFTDFSLHQSRLRIAYLTPFLLTGLIIPLLYIHPEAMTLPNKSSVDKILPHWAPETIPRTHYLFTQFGIICFTYLKLLVLPWGQSFDHEYVIREIFLDKQVLTPFLILAILFILALLTIRRLRFLSYSLFWFFITLSPTSSIIPSKQVVAEHRVYLPMVSICFVMAQFILCLKNIKARLLCFVSILAIFSILTIHRNTVWKDGYSIWSDVVSKSPTRDRPHLALGDIYFQRREYEKAALAYQKFLQLNQQYSEGFIRLGRAYMNLAYFEKAVDEFNKAAVVNPKNPSTYRHLTSAYLNLDNIGMAIKVAKKLISLNPTDIRNYYNLAGIYVDREQWDEAKQVYLRIIMIDPNQTQAYSNLGTIYRKLGNWDVGIEAYQEALERSTPLEESFIRLNLGQLYQEMGRLEKAIFEFSKLLDIMPHSPQAHINLSKAYFEIKEFKKSILHCDKALELGFKAEPSFLNKLSPYR